MSEQNNNASGRSHKRGRGNRRPGGSRGNYNSSRGGLRPNRKPPEPTGFQKFLSIITFGLYKPHTIPAVRTPNRNSSNNERELGPIARADREAARRERRTREGRPQRERETTQVTTEVVNERLYVGNLSYDATESDLFELFSGAGSVRNAEVVVNSRTQRSKGFAFVTMGNIDDAKRAVSELNGKDFMGRPLIVGGAKPMPAREDRNEASAPAPAPVATAEAPSESESTTNPEPVA